MNSVRLLHKATIIEQFFARGNSASAVSNNKTTLSPESKSSLKAVAQGLTISNSVSLE